MQLLLGAVEKLKHCIPPFSQKPEVQAWGPSRWEQRQVNVPHNAVCISARAQPTKKRRRGRTSTSPRSKSRASHLTEGSPASLLLDGLPHSSSRHALSLRAIPINYRADPIADQVYRSAESIDSFENVHSTEFYWHVQPVSKKGDPFRPTKKNPMIKDGLFFFRRPALRGLLNPRDPAFCFGDLPTLLAFRNPHRQVRITGTVRFGLMSGHWRGRGG